MSMNNKQRWMGGVVLLGGGVLLAALLLKGNEEIKQVEVQSPASTSPKTQTKPKQATEGQMVQLQPLAVDVETEKRLLEEQRRSREKAVAEQEARAAEFLAMQQQAEADAARKAAAEYAAINARRTAAQESSDNIPPELVGEAKAKNQQANVANKTTDTSKIDADKKAAEAKRQAEAAKKAAEAKRQAEADKKAAEAKRQAEADKKTTEAKRQAEADKKAAETKRQAEADKKAAEAKRQAEADKKASDAKRKAEADKKADAEKARELLENGDKKWMVQVALAANQANADSVVSKLRAKGYKVTTSQTSKGIRIMVGPAKDRDTADAARKKITSDSSLNMKSAWVIDWVPLDQR
ncbi:Sporulation related domain protein [Acinetobacter calcoaceticus]|uniref:Sporulation related domain protein n=1 Tax=Acinetobacter calcoaceticus TaxID=471 RepID=A0A446ZG56_ACICA|nr:SPOR domain-containing protein [Acinetobacter calcoaceticus]VAX43446.1 Sporulation related domain protein [Acinetobacter calcoaceticus]